MNTDIDKDFVPAQIQKDFFNYSPCIIDNYTADFFSTIDKKETKITLDSDTAQPDQYYITTLDQKKC